MDWKLPFGRPITGTSCWYIHFCDNLLFFVVVAGSYGQYFLVTSCCWLVMYYIYPILQLQLGRCRKSHIHVPLILLDIKHPSLSSVKIGRQLLLQPLLSTWARPPTHDHLKDLDFSYVKLFLSSSLFCAYNESLFTFLEYV